MKRNYILGFAGGIALALLYSKFFSKGAKGKTLQDAVDETESDDENFQDRPSGGAGGGAIGGGGGFSPIPSPTDDVVAMPKPLFPSGNTGVVTPTRKPITEIRLPITDFYNPNQGYPKPLFPSGSISGTTPSVPIANVSNVIPATNPAVSPIRYPTIGNTGVIYSAPNREYFSRSSFDGNNYDLDCDLDI
jgi:hypothetical protein